jgi:hypothetical protein
MAGAGYRTFQSGEVLTANNVQTYLMDQAVQVYAGTAARSSAVPTPSAGMVAYSTATGLQVFDGSAWTDVGGVGYGEATGGASTAITVGGESYTLLTFTSTGTLTVSKAGLFDVLVTAGGAGGGVGNIGGGGGGGAGGLFETTVYLAANTTITIGAGGAGSSTTVVGASGSFSGLNNVARSVVATGGGLGGGRTSGIDFDALAGGSGGGGGRGLAGAVSLANAISGNSGGSSNLNNGGGGGGGATAVGVNGSAGSGGAGGAGYDVGAFISGTLFKCGGGGGGRPSSSPGAGGSSVGGDGGTVAGASAAANTASGGGGGGTDTGGNGGSGIVYIRFKV